MEEHSEQVMKFAKLWEVENIEDLTMELDANLRQHRPRAGRVEEDLARAREVELLEQQRRANNFIRYLPARCSVCLKLLDCLGFNRTMSVNRR